MADELEREAVGGAEELEGRVVATCASEAEQLAGEDGSTVLTTGEGREASGVGENM